MIPYLSKHTFGRILLLPLVILFGAYSWLTIINGTPNEQDAARPNHWWGWLDPRMDEHWLRVAAHEESAYETLKNVGSERFKLVGGQTAYKSGSFTLVSFLILGMLTAFISGLLL